MEIGPGHRTLCNPEQAARFKGLSGCDNLLLRRHLSTISGFRVELHTGVTVGVPDDVDPQVEADDVRGVMVKAWGYQCDALLRVSSGWELIECKPAAGYEAVGQVLFYRWFLRRSVPELRISRLLVLTDECVGCVVEFAKSYRVEILPLGVFSPPLRGRWAKVGA